MKLFPLSKNAMILSLATIIAIGFFVAGLFKILDYFIVKALLFLSFGSIIVVAVIFALKNDIKKNRPEETLQDD